MHDARQKGSPGGKKITKEEWKEILLAAFAGEVDHIAAKLARA